MNDDRFAGDAKTHVDSFIADCSEAVQHLARELEKIKKDEPPSAGDQLSMKAKLSNAGKTLLYPFCESTLTKLRGYVEEVRETCRWRRIPSSCKCDT
jgi:hypothetical protein